MGINEIIMYIMMFFMLIAAVDRILSQFGGSARFLGKLGKSIEGSGGQFEEGFMAMGALGLAMVGMTALAPVLAHLLGPVIIPLYEMLGANPSMFAGTLLACDMGGFFLAKELAGGDVAACRAALDAGAAAARRTGCVISRREIGRPEEDTQRLIGGFQPPPPAPMPPADPASSEALLTLLASVRQGMTAGEVAAHFAWPLDKARQALEQLFSAGTLRKRSSRYRLKNP